MHDCLLTPFPLETCDQTCISGALDLDRFASPIHGMQVAQGFIDLALKQGGNITAENMSFDPLLVTGSHRLLHVQRCTNYISVQSVGMAVAPATPIEYWLEI